jgi:N-acetylglucosamine-6-phosphate deacetylase
LNTRNPADGSEILGVHAEGPFINPVKRGIHKLEVLQRPLDGIRSLEACYGAAHLSGPHPTISKVTLAPELDPSGSTIRDLVSRGIVVAAGHSEATYEEMQGAVNNGVTMVTHLFNAMRRPHHRDPGIFGILGAQVVKRPFFGLIVDAIHVHASMVSLAYEAHPEGLILVSDAMGMLGLPDGEYEWTNGEKIVKNGGKLTLNGSDQIAGRYCLRNLGPWETYLLTGTVASLCWSA